MKDFNIYNLRMVAAMQEKLFFLDKINLKEYDFIVDFGCATGELIRNIIPAVRQPGGSPVIITGFDINEDMLRAARHNIPGEIDNIEIDLCRDLIELEYNLKRAKKSLIIFSSVMHEMSQTAQRRVITTLMPKFDTIVIRDMKRPLNNEPVANITRKRVLSKVAPWQAAMFESRWGKIKDKETLYRFFLMNEFVENFESEVEEDYFGVLWSEIDWQLEDDYKKVFESSYTLPYRKQQVKRVFDHVMHDITHRKVIYTRNK